MAIWTTLPIAGWTESNESFLYSEENEPIDEKSYHLFEGMGMARAGISMVMVWRISCINMAGTRGRRAIHLHDPGRRNDFTLRL